MLNFVWDVFHLRFQQFDSDLKLIDLVKAIRIDMYLQFHDQVVWYW